MALAAIYADLKRDHDKQRKMLKELAELTDTAKRGKLFEDFRLEVQSHAAAEEESLYATMLRDPNYATMPAIRFPNTRRSTTCSPR